MLGLESVKQVIHKCVQCNKLFPHSFTTFCDSCGTMIDIEYDLAKVNFHNSPNPLERFFDLLPIEDSRNIFPIDMNFTPCLHAQKLGKWLGLTNLYIKDETVLPTGTTKDRMAAVVLPFLRECGINKFCTSSTGNSSTSLAYAISYYPEMLMYLFSGEDFKDRLHYADKDQIVNFVLQDATFVEAFICAGQFAKKHNLISEQGFFNPSRREGLKLAFLEAAEQISPPIDWYVQAISSAMGVYGVFKGAKELAALGKLSQLPRLLCVQQETCAPMVQAFQEGSEVIKKEHIIPKPKGIASAILRGDPTRVYPYMRNIVLESNGTFVSVSEANIREARQMAEELEGLSPCFASATALAGVVQLIKKGVMPNKDTILINFTGRDRDPAQASQNIHWLKASDNGWVVASEDDQLAKQLWS